MKLFDRRRSKSSCFESQYLSSRDAGGEQLDADTFGRRDPGRGLWHWFPDRGRTNQKDRPANQGGRRGCQGRVGYHDVKIVEVEGKGPDGKPNKTYNVEPRAERPISTTANGRWSPPRPLKDPRSTGQVCFCWYRTKITIPPEAAGKAVFFTTTVDDYGEVWVDGKLPRTPGKGGEAIVAGFNAPNRVELKDPQPGKVYQIAVFAINGPISAAPSNWLFLKNTALEIVDKPSK